MVGSFGVIVDDDHVEEMTPSRFHVTGGSNYLFQIVIL